MARLVREFIARDEHIDALGHVNNTVWLDWVQQIATAHWDAAARAEDHARYYWVVIRHEIDYRGNIASGERVRATTWIEGAPQGAKSVRRVDFCDSSGRKIVSARTTWAMLDKETHRLVRVRAEVVAPFQGEDDREGKDQGSQKS